MKPTYIQYGCGHHAPAEWINFDASPTLMWERLPILGWYSKNAARFPANVRVGNIVKGLPIPHQSCHGIYASHVLEHLSLQDFHKALENTKQLLKPGGIFRLVVPDLEHWARVYLKGLEDGDSKANSAFLSATGLGVDSRKSGILSGLYASLRTSAHLWMWDSQSLKTALEQHGFKDVRRCEFGDCTDPMFQLVEDRGRFEDAVAMEGKA